MFNKIDRELFEQKTDKHRELFKNYVNQYSDCVDKRKLVHTLSALLNQRAILLEACKMSIAKDTLCCEIEEKLESSNKKPAVARKLYFDDSDSDTYDFPTYSQRNCQ